MHAQVLFCVLFFTNRNALYRSGPNRREKPSGNSHRECLTQRTINCNRGFVFWGIGNWKSTLWNLPEICHLGVRKSCSWEGVSPEASGGVPGEAAGPWMLQRPPVLWSLVLKCSSRGPWGSSTSCRSGCWQSYAPWGAWGGEDPTTRKKSPLT